MSQRHALEVRATLAGLGPVGAGARALAAASFSQTPSLTLP